MKTTPQTAELSSLRRIHNNIGRKCYPNRFDCHHCKGGLGVNKSHDKHNNVRLRKGPIWTRDGIKKWLDKSFNQEHFSMIEDLMLGEEAKIVHEGQEINNNEIQRDLLHESSSPKAPPPSEDGEEVEDIGRLAMEMEKMEFNGGKIKDQQLLESHISNELNETFISDSNWTRDSISNWLDEGTSETWSMAELVQDYETKSLSVEYTNQTPTSHLSLETDSKESPHIDANPDLSITQNEFQGFEMK